MIPQPITVDGYAGDVPEEIEEVGARVDADLDRMFPGGWHARYEAHDPEVREARRALFEHHLFMPRAVKCHNDAVPAAQAHASAARLAVLAVAAADQAYAELSFNTTINWLAAHHRYITASIEARRLLTEVVDTATALRDGEFGKEMAALTLEHYRQHVPAGQRITVPDVDAAELALAEFVETTRERIDVLRATVSGGYPAGFAPLPAEPAPAPSRPVDGDWAAETSASTGVVVSGRGRGW